MRVLVTGANGNVGQEVVRACLEAGFEVRAGDLRIQVIVQTVLHVGLRSGEAEAIDDQQLTLLGRPATPIARYLDRARGLWALPG
jgi:nucleoside-diphosphate-sugar epimerase